MTHIEYDEDKVSKKEALSLSIGLRKIISEVKQISWTGKEDVFVYANSSPIRVDVAPIEVFVRISAHKIKNRAALLDELTSKLKSWKKETSFKHKINLSLIPMDWNIAVGI